jgi:hypothetical protein
VIVLVLVLVPVFAGILVILSFRSPGDEYGDEDEDEDEDGKIARTVDLQR